MNYPGDRWNDEHFDVDPVLWAAYHRWYALAHIVFIMGLSLMGVYLILASALVSVSAGMRVVGALGIALLGGSVFAYIQARRARRALEVLKRLKS